RHTRSKRDWSSDVCSSDLHVGDRSVRPVDAGTPQIRGLQLAHLTATNVHASAGHIFGLPEAPLTGLSIHDLSVSFADAPRPGAQIGRASCRGGAVGSVDAS